MRTFLRDVLLIIRPFGLRRLVWVGVLVIAQAVAQIAAVFSLLPFLSAAADMAQFRRSAVGSTFISVMGDGSNERIIIVAGIVSLVILIGGNLTTLLAEHVRTQYAHQLGHWMRIRLLANVLERRYEYFLGVNSSVLLKNLIEDVGTFAQNMLLPALDVVARGVMVVLLGLSILILEPVVFAFAVGTMAVYFLVVIRPIRRRAAKTSDRVQHDIRAVYFSVYQVLSGVKPILASDRQPYFVDRVEGASAAVSKEMSLIPIYAAVPRSGLEILVFGGLIVWVLVTLISGGDMVSMMPRVGLIAIIAYRLMPSLQVLFGQTMTITSSRQAMEEVLQLLREQPAMAVRSEIASTKPKALEWHDTLQFEGVGFSYAGADRQALKNISFTVRKGESVAFVGATGSGKSTLIDLLLGLLQPGEGRILVDGKLLDAERAPHWRRAVGYVPQDLFLYDATIAENIAFGRKPEELDFERVKASAAIAHAAEFIERQDPAGYSAMVGERGVRLSGGQRQRLALARALYDAPSTLVLDEATSALDPNTEKSVVASLSKMHEKLTTITVTHRLNTIRNCDRIYFISHGEIVASGTYEELQQHANFETFSQ